VSLNGTVKIEGLAAIERTLLAIGKPATAKRIGRKALRAGAEPIRALAESKAPDDPATSGMLHTAIGIADTRARGDSVWIRIGVDSSRDPARAVARKSGKGAYRDPGVAGNAVIQEFGTAKMQANPFMRPAWEAEGRNAPGRIAAVLGPEVEKAAKRAKVSRS